VKEFDGRSAAERTRFAAATTDAEFAAHDAEGVVSGEFSSNARTVAAS
jgi:hypothetical protein